MGACCALAFLARSNAGLVYNPVRRCPRPDRPNRQILLAERPSGKLQESHFKTVEGTVGEPGPGEVLVRTVLLSIDPANRAWMQGRTYREQLGAGEVMAGFTLGEVIAANGASLP